MIKVRIDLWVVWSIDDGTNFEIARDERRHGRNFKRRKKKVQIFSPNFILLQSNLPQVQISCFYIFLINHDFYHCYHGIVTESYSMMINIIIMIGY